MMRGVRGYFFSMSWFLSNLKRVAGPSHFTKDNLPAPMTLSSRRLRKLAASQIRNIGAPNWKINVDRWALVYSNLFLSSALNWLTTKWHPESRLAKQIVSLLTVIHSLFHALMIPQIYYYIMNAGTFFLMPMWAGMKTVVSDYFSAFCYFDCRRKTCLSVVVYM